MISGTDNFLRVDPRKLLRYP